MVFGKIAASKGKIHGRTRFFPKAAVDLPRR
jgi:hypothetical protein